MATNWDDLRVALAIGRTGSLTRAAEVLGVDQSTVGRRLAALEAALGTVLFVRSKAGLSPTEAGEAAIQRAIEIELRVDRLSEQLALGPGGPAGLVRLVGNPWPLELLALRAVHRLLAAHPRLELRMISAHPRAHARPEATMGLWFEAPPRESEFAITLCAVPYAVFAAEGADAAALPWVGVHDEDSPRLAPTRALDRLRRRDEHVRLTATDNGMLAAAIRAGAGKGLLPVCLARSLPGLARVGSGPAELVRQLHLHLHPDTVQTVRVQAVVRWLRECAETTFSASDLI